MVRGGRPKELRERDVGDKACPLLLAACVVAGKGPIGRAECWRIKCQLWIPTQLSCGLELLRLEDTLARSVGTKTGGAGPAKGPQR